ncbi:hypothetical protein Ade02nite_26130 [Paractinoplanes deccanensis]|uniref:Uncharacterized protein n=1 Tax=Paractinoplanes deccanensis TaxID=113561 RepID=A0ABQ3Y1X9_9ACTN|nr:hypothetical protein Ade02nite_26130 [Actinoplanes deccanensis]
MVLGDPEPGVAQLVGGLRDLDRAAQGIRTGMPLTHRSQVEDGKWDTVRGGHDSTLARALPRRPVGRAWVSCALAVKSQLRTLMDDQRLE